MIDINAIIESLVRQLQGIVGYIILFFVLKRVLVEVFRSWLTERGKRRHVIWLEKRELKKERAKLKAQIKERDKYSKVYQGNPVLESILKHFNIIVHGGLGAGKSLFANVLVHYLSAKYEKEDRKNTRFNKYMRSDYIEEIEGLRKNGFLRVYSNIKLKGSDGRVNQDIWPILMQSKRAVHRGIMFSDEFGADLGKWLYSYKKDAQTESVLAEIEDMSRYARQYRELKWIGTEHDPNNVFKPIRDRGFVPIEALRTYVSISKFGKIKRRFINTLRATLPAFLTINIVKEWNKCMFVSEKIGLVFKSLVTAWWTLPLAYYRAKVKTNNSVKAKHTLFAIIIKYGGFERMFKFTNKDKFDYDTHGARGGYDKKFNEEGLRAYA